MRKPSAPAIGALVSLAVLFFILPTDFWLHIGERFSPDGRIDNAGVRLLVANSGRGVGVVVLFIAGALYNRRLVGRIVETLGTCPAHQWFFVMAALVVVPRVVYMTFVHTTPHADLEWYVIHARNLAGGIGYLENDKPTAFWPIGYPAFLALLYRAFGMRLVVVKIAHVVLSLLTATFVWRIGRRLMHERAARLASAIYALCPSMVMFTELTSTEIFFGALLTLLWLLLLAQDAMPASRRVWIGVLAGIGMLTKPVLQPWPALGLLLVRGVHGLREAMVDILVVYVIAGALCAPWVYRNTTTFGRPVGLSTNTGFNLYVGNAEGANGGVRVLPAREWDPLYAMTNEADRDAIMQARALEAIGDDPGRFLRLAPAKWAALFANDQAALRWAASAPEADWPPVAALLARVSLDGYYYLCLLATLLWCVRVALLGGWRRRTAAQRRGWLMLWSWAAYLCLVHAVFYGDPRYHQALWPLLALTTADGLHRTRRST